MYRERTKGKVKMDRDDQLMTKKLHGRVRGRTIELDEELGVADGQEVEIQIQLVTARKWGEGILRSAGGWAEHPEMDDIMEKLYQERKLERSPQMDYE